MLTPLFGNKNVEKILLFLFVNGKCYGSQLSQQLQSPLIPLQNALLRLEKGGIIVSSYEGKTRIYQFNNSFPLFKELEELLKKNYTLLPAVAKKEYYVQKQQSLVESGIAVTKMQVLLSFWDHLKSVKSLSFTSKTNLKEEHGRTGKGVGNVRVSKEGNQIVFTEKGSWQGKHGEMVFSNVFRWTLDRNAEVVSLEHLRRGVDNPVFIFHLAPSSSASLASVDSHLCGGDTYLGQIHFDSHSLRLNWRVIGPKKNEIIDYHYYRET